MKYKLYTDNVKLDLINTVSIGGYLEDEEGNVVFEYSKSVDYNNEKYYDLYSIEFGLIECLKRKILEVECFSEIKPVVKILKLRDKDRARFQKYTNESALLHRLSTTLTYFDDIKFRNIKHDRNKIADQLSRQTKKEIIKSEISPRDVSNFNYIKEQDSRDYLDTRNSFQDTLVFNINVYSRSIETYHLQKVVGQEKFLIKSQESIFSPKGLSYKKTIEQISQNLEKLDNDKCRVVLMDGFSEKLYEFLSGRTASFEQGPAIKKLKAVTEKKKDIILCHDEQIENFIRSLKETPVLPYNLYVEGSRLKDTDVVSIGGCLLDKKGEKVFEFSSILDNPVGDKFEHYALEKGLQECLKRGIKSVSCFGDLKQLMYMSDVSDQEQMEELTKDDPLLKNIIELKKEFNDVNFTFIHSYENKEAVNLCKKALLEKYNDADNIVFNPNSQKNNEQDLKDVTSFVAFKLDGCERTVTAYKINKDPQFNSIFVQEEKKFSVETGRFTKGALQIIADTLGEVESDKCGVVLLGYVDDMVENYLKGTSPITMEYVGAMHKLSKVSEKFNSLFLCKDEQVINTISYPGEFDDSKRHNVDFSSVNFIKLALSALGAPNYKLGNEPQLESCLDLKGGKERAVSDIQRIYFLKMFGILEKTQNRYYTEEEKIVEIPILKEKLKKEGINLVF